MQRTLITLTALSLAGLALSACSAPAALRVDDATARSHVITDVNVYDPALGELRTGQTVLVVDGVIRELGEGEAPPADLPVIDADGQVLMPGLIDMHVHLLDEAELAANLAYGVTTIRNLGGMPFHLGMAERIERRDLLGPRLLTTGTIINERDSRSVHGLQSLVSSEAEARAVVQDQYAAGYRHLKVYSNLSRESFAAVRDEADRLGMTLSGHPVEGMPDDPLDIGATLDAGFATIEHVESIVWHALQDDQDPDRARALAARFAEAGATVSPTLIVHQNLALITERGEAHLNRPEMAGFNPVMYGFEAETYEFWVGFQSDNRSVMQAFYVEMTGYLHEAGVELVVGTDAGVMVTPFGYSVSQEIELLVDAGLTPDEALAAATVNPARALGMAGEIGCVDAGCRADFILLPSDPRADLSVLRRPTGVMRDGLWLDETRLAALSDRSEHPSEPRTWWRLLRFMVSR